VCVLVRAAQVKNSEMVGGSGVAGCLRGLVELATQTNNLGQVVHTHIPVCHQAE